MNGVWRNQVAGIATTMLRQLSMSPRLNLGTGLVVDLVNVTLP